MTYDELCINYEDTVKIKERNLIRDCQLIGIENVKGLYNNGKIAIDRTLTNREKKCTLAEELGHHYTSAGNIIDLNDYRNAKQEYKAREWAALKLIDQEDFIKAVKLYDNIYQIADELDVTVEFVLIFYNKILSQSF